MPFNCDPELWLDHCLSKEDKLSCENTYLPDSPDNLAFGNMSVVQYLRAQTGQKLYKIDDWFLQRSSFVR